MCQFYLLTRFISWLGTNIEPYEMVKYRKLVENWCSHVPKRTTPVGGARRSEHFWPTSAGGASIEWVKKSYLITFHCIDLKYNRYANTMSLIVMFSRNCSFDSSYYTRYYMYIWYLEKYEFMYTTVLHNIHYYTVKLWSLEVVGTIFTSSNHPKCELNSHFWCFWLVKIATTTMIWVQKDKKHGISSQPRLIREFDELELSVLELSKFNCNIFMRVPK